MKIIHVLWALENGGVETMLVNIVNEQVLCGNKVFIIIINDLVNKDLLRNINPKVKIYQIGRSGGSKNIWSIFKINFISLVIYPQIVHFHFLDIAKYFIKYPKIKFISTVHTTAFPDTYFKKYKTIIAISKAVIIKIKQIKPELTPIICYNGVDFSRLKKKKRYRKIKNIICVGRLVNEIKNQEVIIKAAEILQVDYGLFYDFHFIGTGSSENYLKGLTKTMDLNNNVKFAGNMSNHWVLNNLSKFDLFVQASLVEGFGLTALEAIGAKVPTLLSNVEGHLEISDNGRYASLFNPNNPHDLADKIAVLSKEFETLENKSKISYNYALNRFSIRKQVECLNAVYKL